MKGFILLAHGSRDPQWTAPFEQIRAEVERRLPECATALAYLEHSEPDFMTAVDRVRFILKPFIGDARAVLDAIADYAASDFASEFGAKAANKA